MFIISLSGLLILPNATRTSIVLLTIGFPVLKITFFCWQLVILVGLVPS